jgi:hypothetical protein
VADGLDLRILRLPGLGADIDEATDLATLLKCRGGSTRYGFLEPVSRVLDPVEHRPAGANGP